MTHNACAFGDAFMNIVITGISRKLAGYISFYEVNHGIELRIYGLKPSYASLCYNVLHCVCGIILDDSCYDSGASVVELARSLCRIARSPIHALWTSFFSMRVKERGRHGEREKEKFE